MILRTGAVAYPPRDPNYPWQVKPVGGAPRALPNIQRSGFGGPVKTEKMSRSDPDGRDCTGASYNGLLWTKLTFRKDLPSQRLPQLESDTGRATDGRGDPCEFLTARAERQSSYAK